MYKKNVIKIGLAVLEVDAFFIFPLINTTDNYYNFKTFIIRTIVF